MTNKSVQNTRKKPTSMITDFGLRRISRQNFSKIIAIPKPALENCNKEANQVNVQLVQEKGEKYIKLTPVVMEVSS